MRDLYSRYPGDLPAYAGDEDTFASGYGQKYPEEEQMLGVLGAGAFLASASLLGLRSFKRNPELFGMLGRMMSDPLTGLLDLYDRASYMFRDKATGAPAESALIDYALKRRDEVRAEAIRDRVHQTGRYKQKQLEAQLNQQVQIHYQRMNRNKPAPGGQLFTLLPGVYERASARSQDQAHARYAVSDGLLQNADAFNQRLNASLYDTGQVKGLISKYIQSEPELVKLLSAVQERSDPRSTSGGPRKVAPTVGTYIRALSDAVTNPSALDIRVVSRVRSILKELAGHNDFQGAVERAHDRVRASDTRHGFGIASLTTLDEKLILVQNDPKFFDMVQDELKYNSKRASAAIPTTTAGGRAALSPIASLSLVDESTAFTGMYRSKGYKDAFIPMTGPRGEHSLTDLWRHDPNYMADGAHITLKPGGGYKPIAATNLTDELAGILRDELTQIGVQHSDRRGITMRKVALPGKEGYYAFEIALSNANDGTVEKAFIPIGNNGNYHMPHTDRPVTGKQRLVNQSVLFGHTRQAQALERHLGPGAVVVDATQLTLLQVIGSVHRVGSDLYESSAKGKKAIDRIRKAIFEESSIVNSSFGDTINHISQVSSDSAMFYKKLVEDADMQRQYRQGQQAIERTDRLFNLGQRFYSVDTEFVNDTVGEFGLRKSTTSHLGRTPYQYSGHIMEASNVNGGAVKTMASFNYVRQIYNRQDQVLMGNTPAERQATSDYLKMVREELETKINDFEGRTKDKDQLKILYDRLKKGYASFQLYDQEGKARVFEWDGDGVGGSNATAETKKLLSQSQYRWMAKGKGESFDQHIARVQAELLKRNNVQNVVGQNYMSSDRFFYQDLYKEHPEIARLMGADGVIDGLSIARVLEPDYRNSKALSNLAAGYFDLTQTDFDQVLKATAALNLDTASADDIGMKAYSGWSSKDFNSEQQYKVRQLIKAIQEEHRNGIKGGSLSLHDASFDAAIQGKYALLHLRRMSQTARGQAQRHLVDDALQSARQMGGEVEFFEQHGLSYGPDGAANSVYLPFTNPLGSTWGTGSMLHPGMIAFHRLQNPSRQLYQRIKHMRIRGVKDLTDKEMRVMGFGRSMSMYHYLKNGRIYRPKPSNNAFHVPQSPVVNPLDKRHPMFVPSTIYAGATHMTERAYGVYGMNMMDDFAVNAVTAFLADDHPLVADSMGHATADVLDVTSRSMNVKSESHKLSRFVVEGGETGSISEWVDQELKELRAKKGYGNLGEKEQQLVQKHLREIYVLEQVMQTTSPVKGVRKQIEEEIADRRQRLRGKGRLDADGVVIEKLLEHRRTNLPGRSKFGNGANLFPNMGPGSAISDSVRGPESGAAVLVGVRVHEDGLSGSARNYRIVMDWIDDPTTMQKLMVTGAKVTVSGSYVMDSAGFQGEKVLVGAQAMKLKRMDLATPIQYHLARINRVITGQLEVAGNAGERAVILDTAMDAIRILTGFNKGQVRAMIRGGGGGARGTGNALGIVLTPKMMKEAELKFTTRRAMDAMKKVGLTNRAAAKSLIQGMRANGMSQDVLSDATAAISRRMDESIDAAIKQLEEQINKIASTGDGQQFETGLKDTLRYFHKMRTNRNLFNEEGALHDFYADPQNPSNVVGAYLGRGSISVIQEHTSRASTYGVEFEKATGRATLSKRLSVVSSSLLDMSGTFGLGGRYVPGGDAFADWLAVQSGASQMSGRQFQDQYQAALAKAGVLRDDVAKLEFNATKKAFQVTLHNKKVVDLTMNPFANLTRLAKAQMAVDSMMTGRPVNIAVSGFDLASPNRIMDLAILGGQTWDGRMNGDGRQYSVVDLVAKFGREERAKQYQKYYQGVTVEEVMEPSSRTVVLPKGADGRAAHPFFNRDVGMIRIDLMEGISDSRLTAAHQALRKAGVPETQINMLLGGMSSVVDIVHAVDASDTDRMVAAEAIRNKRLSLMGEAGLTTDIRRTLVFLTEPDAPTEEVGQKFVKANISRSLELLTSERTPGSLQQMQMTIREIVEMSDRLGSNPTAAKLAAYRTEVEKIYRAPNVQQAGEHVQKMESAALHSSMLARTTLAREVMGTYLGGQYKVATGPEGMRNNLEMLRRAYSEGGPSKNFNDIVENLYRQNTLSTYSDAEMTKRMKAASQSLYDYIGSQGPNSEIYTWKGFASGEGFISTTTATKLADTAEMGLSNLKSKRDLAIGEAEVARMRKAIAQPGTEGILSIFSRQPDFASFLPYQFGTLYGMDADAMRVLGIEDQTVVAHGHVLDRWAVRADFDGDTLFSSLVDNAVVAGKMRQQARDQGPLLAVARQVLGRIEGSPQIQGVEFGRDGRVVFNSGEYFKAPTALDQLVGVFGAEGYGMHLTAKGQAARLKQRVQQAVIGNLGKHTKRGAIQVKQAETAFMNISDKLIQRAQGDNEIKTLLNTALRDVGGVEQLTQVRQYYGQAEGVLWSDSFRLNWAADDILQRVGIEKYKTKEALERARHIEEVIDAMRGNVRTRYGDDFDAAFSAFKNFEAKDGHNALDYFISVEKARDTSGILQVGMEEEAALKRAMKAEWRSTRIMNALKKVGIVSDYQLTAANMNASQQRPADQLIQGSLGEMEQFQATGGTARGAMRMVETILGTEDAGFIQKQGAVYDSLRNMLRQQTDIRADASLGMKVNDLLATIPGGGRTAAIAGASLAGLALIGMTNRPEVPGTGEYYDKPRRTRYQRGSRQTTLDAMRRRNRSMLEMDYAMMPEARIGRGYSGVAAPTVFGSF